MSTQANFPCERHSASDTPTLDFMLMVKSPAYQHFPHLGTVAKKVTAKEMAQVQAQVAQGAKFHFYDTLFFTDEWAEALEQLLNTGAFGEVIGKELFAVATLHGIYTPNVRVTELLAARAFKLDFEGCDAAMKASVSAAELPENYLTLLAAIRKTTILQSNAVIAEMIERFKLFG